MAMNMQLVTGIKIIEIGIINVNVVMSSTNFAMMIMANGGRINYMVMQGISKNGNGGGDDDDDNSNDTASLWQV